MSPISLIDKFLEAFVNFNGSITTKIVSRERKKEIRNNFVEWSCKQFEKLPFSMKSIGILIRSFHMASPIGFLLILFLSPSRIICLLIIAFLTFICFSFFFFDICMVSSIENKIIGDEFNIVDPVLELFGLNLTFMNRLKVSYAIGCFYYCCVIIIYVVRFHSKDLVSLFKKYRMKSTNATTSGFRGAGAGASDITVTKEVPKIPASSNPASSNPVASNPASSN